MPPADIVIKQFPGSVRTHTVCVFMRVTLGEPAAGQVPDTLPWPACPALLCPAPSVCCTYRQLAAGELAAGARLGGGGGEKAAGAKSVTLPRVVQNRTRFFGTRESDRSAAADCGPGQRPCIRETAELASTTGL